MMKGGGGGGGVSNKRMICPKTISGKHIWPEWIGSKEFIKCLACGLIDDTKRGER